MIDLTKLDRYPDGVVPDEDVMIALKVIRTVRDIYIGPESFDAEGAVVLSHAHKFIVEACGQIDPANVRLTDREAVGERRE